MSPRWLAALIISCVIDVGVLCAAAAGKPPDAPPALRTETTGSLTVTSMSVPEGTLRINLPADIAAGDTISGTVVAEPAGRSDAQRAANESVLNGYVVDAGGNNVHVAQRMFTFVVPTTATFTLLLRRGNGTVAGRAAIPVRAQQQPIARPAIPSDFKFPQVAVSGQPLTISGHFSGDSARGALAIGGQPAERIAESPRTLVATPPSNVVGPTTMQLTENGVAAAAPCNVITLGLSASSTRLSKGAHATVHVTIAGLNGIRQPVYLRLVNATPAVVAFAGGQTQAVAIQPNDVRPDGTYGTDRDVTGLSAGSFSLYATLDDQRLPLADGAPTAAPGTPAGTTGTAPGDQSGRTVSRDKPTPPPPCKWKAASIVTTPYGVDVKDDKKLKALQSAAAALVSKAAPAAASIVAALPAVFGQVSKNLVEVYITYICVDPTGAVLATRVVHLTDIEALDWSAPDAKSFNSADGKAERQKDIMRNTPH